jgi:hypothetical protein
MGPLTRAWLDGEKVPMQEWYGSSPERSWVDFIGRDFVLGFVIVLGLASLAYYLLG